MTINKILTTICYSNKSKETVSFVKLPNIDHRMKHSDRNYDLLRHDEIVDGDGDGGGGTG